MNLLGFAAGFTFGALAAFMLIFLLFLTLFIFPDHN